jgi:predicted Ser/Thr protein kinase
MAMRAEDALRPAPRTTIPALALLDTGEWSVTPADCEQVLRSIQDGHAPVLATDRNSVCHLARWPADAGFERNVVVKVPRLGPQRTNPDTTFAAEAAILARLSMRDIPDASRLVARVAAGDRHYLVVTHVDGVHPDPLVHPLTRRHLGSVVDSLGRMDELGLMHYDLKPANLLLAGERVAYLDFEFARFALHVDAFDPSHAAYVEDFNVSANPHFPSRTNVANFEFRTLHRYATALAEATSWSDARGFFRDWLACRKRWHARRARFYQELAAASAPELGVRGRLGEAEVHRRLADAAAFERSLSRMLADPEPWVVELEWSLVAFRCHVFERRVREARAQRDAIRATVAQVRRDRPRQRRYLDAVTLAVDRIARSPVPGGTSPSVDFSGTAADRAPRVADDAR